MITDEAGAVQGGGATSVLSDQSLGWYLDDHHDVGGRPAMSQFRFIDLFAGIGGFHAALSALGGGCVFVSEIDSKAAAVYERNWGRHVTPERPGDPVVHGDITQYAPEEGAVRVPKHEILAAGFPCQPFSKSGAQMGVRDRTRGTLFFNILRILDERRPKVIFLENVRNLAGPRHQDTWDTIITSLRDLGYRVSSQPTVFSPHFLPPRLGGTPQVRDRVFILGVYVGRERAWAECHTPPVLERGPVDGWNPLDWDIEHTPLPWNDDRPLLIPDSEVEGLDRYRLSASEERWVACWDDFVARLLEAREGTRLPGFPLWADDFVHEDDLVVPPQTPTWKADFLRKNAAFYTNHQVVIDLWLRAWDNLAGFPPSRRKFEWQAQDAGSLRDCVMHFRPSGIRAKQATYLPALVAITQTSILGSRDRRITPREAARLQGLPDWFDFGPQREADTYRQLGNGVNVGAVYYVLRKFLLDNKHDLTPALRAVATQAPETPCLTPPPATALRVAESVPATTLVSA